MYEQGWENYNATETDRTQRTIAQEENGFLVAAKRGDSTAFEILASDPQTQSFMSRGE